MQATEEELKWAAQIKQAAHDDPDIDATNLSDLEFLQHAIVAKHQTAKALGRIRNLQRFKERYGILKDGSVQEAARDIQAFLNLHPGFCLSLMQSESSFCDATKRTSSISNDEIKRNDKHALDPSNETNSSVSPHVFCCDLGKALGSRMKSEEAYAIAMRGTFYILQASQPNIAAMRAGFCLLGDTKQVSFPNFSFEAEERAAQLYSHAYPIRICQLVLLNTNMIVRFFYNIVKYFVKSKVRKTLLFWGDRDKFFGGDGTQSKNNGGQSSNDNHGPVEYQKCVLPTSWGGTVNESDFKDTVLAKLEERYKNASNFKL